ncbi:MAG: DUF1385 domain-containing protein [Lachnospiraceae bacterium]|nr:DUF1385 domain-containing protein [Lachnospiraceae bacterium]
MERIYVGGQAVLEGVMMKNKDQYAIAVRKPDQTIEVKVENYTAAGDQIPLFRLPIIRGVVNFIESLVIGMKTLTYSASFYEETEEKAEGTAEKVAKKGGESILMFFSVVLSIILALGLFILLPAWLSEFIRRGIDNNIVVALLEGVIRLVIFLLYVFGISLMDDMKRVFMYHGAEHKTINCLEAGVPLTPENVMEFTRFHKRCGTSFLFIVMIISILFFMVIQVDSAVLRILLRLLLVPVIAGVSYEFIRLAGRNDSWIIKALSAPGLWVQRLTTKEPDLEMLEVAIASVEGVLDWRAYQQELKQSFEDEDWKKKRDKKADSKEEVYDTADEAYSDSEDYGVSDAYEASEDYEEAGAYEESAGYGESDAYEASEDYGEPGAYEASEGYGESDAYDESNGYGEADGYHELEY